MKIIPTLHQSTPEFKSLSKENRNCSLTSEVKDDSIFNIYSQKGCIFECTLKKIVRNVKENLKQSEILEKKENLQSSQVKIVR